MTSQRTMVEFEVVTPDDVVQFTSPAWDLAERWRVQNLGAHPGAVVQEVTRITLRRRVFVAPLRASA